MNNEFPRSSEARPTPPSELAKNPWESDEETDTWSEQSHSSWSEQNDDSGWGDKPEDSGWSEQPEDSGWGDEPNGNWGELDTPGEAPSRGSSDSSEPGLSGIQGSIWKH